MDWESIIKFNKLRLDKNNNIYLIQTGTPFNFKSTSITDNDIKYCIKLTKDDFVALCLEKKWFSDDLSSLELADWPKEKINQYSVEIEELRTKFNSYHQYKKDGKMNYIGYPIGADVTLFAGAGIELELSAGFKTAKDYLINSFNYLTNHKDYENLFFAEQDRTIKYGFELISQPHTFETFENFIKVNFKELVDKIKYFGAYDHRINCAAHFHISKYAFGADLELRTENIARLLWFVSENEENFNKLSRLKHHLSPVLHFESYEQALEFTNSVMRPQSYKLTSMPKPDRHHMINIRSDSTVEFRIFETTTNIDELLAYYHLCKWLQERSLYDLGTAWDNWFNQDTPEDVKELINNLVGE